jgi:hypothetical protein
MDVEMVYDIIILVVVKLLLDVYKIQLVSL